MKYPGDKKRLEQLAQKSRRLRYTAEGQITPSLTWEDHLEIEAIQDRAAVSDMTKSRGRG